jgi:ABC-type branched-subunit amino acid transport system substrate-binding protein
MTIGWREVGVGSSAPVEECWRVGVQFSRTVNTAVIEETQLRGTVFPIEEIKAAGGVNGRKFVPVIPGPSSNCENFAKYTASFRLKTASSVFGCCATYRIPADAIFSTGVG